MIREIKNLEYRIDVDNVEVIDVVFTDNTKTKLKVADLTKELESIDSQITALRRRHGIVTKSIALIDTNRGQPVEKQLLAPALSK